MTNNCTYFCNGKFLKAALIFGTPGIEEEFNNFPIPGRIRKNLEVILEKLKTQNYFIEYENIYDFRITHAVTSAFKYKNRTKKEKAIMTEVLSEHNLKRLLEEIIDIKELIICFGNKAHLAIEKIKPELNQDVKIIKVLHLSPVSFNSIKGALNYDDKIDHICDDITMQIKSELSLTVKS